MPTSSAAGEPRGRAQRNAPNALRDGSPAGGRHSEAKEASFAVPLRFGCRNAAGRTRGALTGAPAPAYSCFSRRTPRRRSAATSARGSQPATPLLWQGDAAYSSRSMSFTQHCSTRQDPRQPDRVAVPSAGTGMPGPRAMGRKQRWEDDVGRMVRKHLSPEAERDAPLKKVAREHVLSEAEATRDCLQALEAPSAVPAVFIRPDPSAWRPAGTFNRRLIAEGTVSGSALGAAISMPSDAKKHGRTFGPRRVTARGPLSGRWIAAPSRSLPCGRSAASPRLPGWRRRAPRAVH